MPNYYNEYKSKTILRQYGIPTGQFSLAAGRKEAEEIAETYGYPLVMKIVSDQIIHKTEAGGIQLNIKNAAEVRKSYDQLITNAKNYDPGAVIEGVLITPMAPAGIQVIAGGMRDVQFGPVIMFGLGGIFVEILQDVQFRMAPVTKKEALSLIRSIRAFPVLAGARAQKPVNLDALADLLVKTSNFLADNDAVKEVDLNPVICYDDKVEALDAVIGVESLSSV